MRHLLDDPSLLRVHAGLAPAGCGILDEPLPVPHQTADIKIVIEDTGAPAPVAVDGRRPPGHAMGPRNTSAIETMRDGAWALPVGKCGKDPLYNTRLFRVHFALAAN